MRNLIVQTLLLVLVSHQANAQRAVTDSTIGTPWVSIHYGASFTGGDLNNRHGFLNDKGKCLNL